MATKHKTADGTVLTDEEYAALTTVQAKRDAGLIHDVDVVYEQVDGGNDDITFDAEDADGNKIPVTTKLFGREENHFTFD